ncbi:glycine betaine ABC transporter substrate-binding protein [Nocardioides sp. KR10-350]|uniref:glycine betaine ABC transporter substrate-binding protein n=1 Tax=Nocardioides cheoyonin TaxID=3156615 RepID=UPI0032B42445
MRLRSTLLAVLVTLAVATSGCSIGLGTAGGYSPSGQLAGPLADVKRLDGATISVGSKNFTEQVLLGKMTVILLKSAGADVKDLTNIPGSAAARQAQLVNQVQMEWEYTGTAWLTYLGHDKPIPQSHQQYVAVRDEELKENNLVWLPPTPMNDTYDMAVTQQTAKKYGLTSLSDIAKVPVADRTFCVESEFTDRPDGLKGMLDTYGVPLGSAKGVPRKNLLTLQTGAIYDATAKGDCTFGEVFTTDGRIQALNLIALKDDKSFFPKYNGSLVVRKELLDEYPQIADLIAPVSQRLTNPVIAKLNAEVDVEGREPADVAYEWLKSQGLVTD